MGPRDVRVVREFLSLIIVRILKVYFHVHKLNKCQKATDLNNRKVALWSSESDTFSPFQKIMRK